MSTTDIDGDDNDADSSVAVSDTTSTVSTQHVDQTSQWRNRNYSELIASVPTTLAIVLGVLPLILLFIESIGPTLTVTNYAAAMKPLYRQTLIYSLGIGIVVTITCIIIAYPVTYWLTHRCPRRYRLLGLLGVTLPLWLNYVVLNYTWVWILARGGLLNAILTGLGIISAPTEALYTEISMLLGFIYIYLPYVILTLFVSMEQLDYRLIEVARDLGATNIRVIWDVIVPQTYPGALAGALIVYARIAGAYATPEILGGPGDVMIATLIVDAFQTYFEYGFAAALSFIFLVVVIAGILIGVTIPQIRAELRQW
ncbi:ABC transporter permease [Haloquadratum walsbyi]|uniref:ABC-type spermidine/putrescine transport system, permease component I n=1 Tax=Haloquadratum walsbyi J07HQW2 TaxID=1238425 RepID=U1NFK1_9EURY|nr:ABC transporter permease [Haloquadratum walsbyi]ERG95593.1 MAG: ABC-type spermidine/putrescine transport system, permease component I [Haloquadratum walsbyi J07HQW2]